MLLGTLNKPVMLSLATADGRTDLFCQAKILDSTGTLLTTLSVPHQNLGVYGVSHTPSAEGYFNIVYKLYTDAGYTIDAGYDLSAEILDVSTLRTDVLRILGLVHENAVVDQQIYDGDENLTSARIRCYNNATNAQAASAISPTTYTTGQLFEYQLTATYSGGLLNKYNINRVL